MSGPVGADESRRGTGFVGVDITHATRKLLVQQGALDGSLAALEEFDKLIEFDFQGLGTPRFEAMSDTQTSEAPRIDETQFPARGQLCHQVSVLCHFAAGRANDHAPGHAQVNDPLRV